MKRFTALMFSAVVALAVLGCNEAISNNPIYNPTEGCKQDADCSGGFKCSPMGVCVVICRPGVEGDCSSGQYCLPGQSYCVDCLLDEHCADDEYCSEFNVCLARGDVDGDDVPPDGDDPDNDPVVVDGDDTDTVDTVDNTDDPTETDIVPDGDVDTTDTVDSDPPVDGDVDAVDSDPDIDTDPDPEFTEEIPSTCNPGEGYCFAPNEFRRCNDNGDGWVDIQDCNAPLDQCNNQICDTVARCVPAPLPNGSFCNDYNNASYPDVCMGGSCVQGTPVARITLIWETAGADLDIHLLKPGSTYDPAVRDGDNPGDCNYANKTPDWGTTGDDNDDPRLLLDDINGTGPEELILPRAGDTGNYLIWMRWYSGSNPSSTLDQVRAVVSVFTADGRAHRFDVLMTEPGQARQVAWMRAVAPDQVQLEAICEEGCPGGTVCSPHGCDTPCSGTCGAGQQCVEGQCVNDCRSNNNQCSGDLHCDAFSGLCVDGVEPPVCPPCNEGEHCGPETNYECVPDAQCIQEMDACSENSTCCGDTTCCTGINGSVCCPPGACMDLFGCMPGQ